MMLTDLGRHGRETGPQVAAEARLPLADDVPGVPVHAATKFRDTGLRAACSARAYSSQSAGSGETYIHLWALYLLLSRTMRSIRW
jgi:hypothetical protein